MDRVAAQIIGPLPEQAPSAAPRVIADLRPTADAAALAHASRPETPLGTGWHPASASQAGAVNQSMLATAPQKAAPAPIAPVDAPERVLKPYGVTMLPHIEARARARQAADAEAGDQAAAAAAEQKASNSAETARLAQAEATRAEARGAEARGAEAKPITSAPALSLPQADAPAQAPQPAASRQPSALTNLPDGAA